LLEASGKNRTQHKNSAAIRPNGAKQIRNPGLG
jgi:hypothetical protein